MKISFNARLNEDTISKIKSLAEKANRTQANMLEVIIDDYFEVYEHVNPFEKK